MKWHWVAKIILILIFVTGVGTGSLQTPVTYLATQATAIAGRPDVPPGATC